MLPPAATLHDVRSRGNARWSTSSFGSEPNTSLLDTMSLREHLDRCRRARSVFFRAQSLADAVAAFLAPRAITTLVVIALAAGAAFLFMSPGG